MGSDNVLPVVSIYFIYSVPYCTRYVIDRMFSQDLGYRVEVTLPRAVRRGLYVAARPAACQGHRRLHMSHTILIADDNLIHS